MIHLWYSARLPVSILKSIAEKIVPLIEDVCTKIASKPDYVPLRKSFKLASGHSIHIVLTKPDWMRFKAYFTAPANLTPTAIEAVRTKAINDTAYRDPYQNAMYTFWPALRVCEEKFRRRHSPSVRMFAR
jgi:hypothetical protein